MVLGGVISCSGKSDPATSDWPPVSAAARQDFEANSGLYGDLVSDLDHAGYFQVILIGDDVRAAALEDTETIWEVPSDPDRWRSRMSALELRRVVRVDVSWFLQKAAVDGGDGREYLTFFIRDEDSDWKECRSEQSGIRCGVCGETLDERWSLRIVWSPIDLGMDAFDGLRTGEESIEEAVSEIVDLSKECLRQGFEELGYDTSVF